MSGKLKFIENGWKKELLGAFSQDTSALRIVCPFIKEPIIRELLEVAAPSDIRIITRYNLDDFYSGVSDPSALRLLLKKGAKIRGVKNLHSKMYLFGSSRAVVTSANLTKAALTKNHEFGFVSADSGVISSCEDYFQNLWGKIFSEDLTTAKLDDWDVRITAKKVAAGGLPPSAGLGDEGDDVGLPPISPIMNEGWPTESRQAFVKFFGSAKDREAHNLKVIEEVDRSGCFYACTYPKRKRPGAVQDGAIMFMSRLVKDPYDIVVFGRAIGMKHVRGRDEATREEILLRDFKKTWSNYIRVHDPVFFVAGTLENGVSLNELMNSLGPSAFASTKRNASTGIGNTTPSKAYSQQAHVELSEEGLAWLNEKLQAAFNKHGTIPADEISKLKRS